MANRAQRMIQVAERYDRLTSRAEASVVGAMHTAIDRAYRELVMELEQGWSAIAANKSLIPQQQRLLLIDQLGELLQVIRPSRRAEYEKMLADAIERGDALGAEYLSRVNVVLQPSADQRAALEATTGVPLDALRHQVTDGLRRLYYHGGNLSEQIPLIVEQGLLQNWGIRRTAAAIESTAGVVKAQAETIARTQVMGAFNGATRSRLIESDSWAQWIAVGDSRTCPACSYRNTRVYKPRDIEIPCHARCRCILSPMRRDWLNDPDFFSDDDLAEMERYRQEGLDALATTGKKPRPGAPFDPNKKPPRPVWTPGQFRPT
ncbi:MAG: minor capsid protein [Spirulina sp.]